MTGRQIRKGDPVRYQDCFNRWWEGWAVSGVEGTHVFDEYTSQQIRRHSFEGIYVSQTRDGQGMFWPVEDVEPRTVLHIAEDEGDTDECVGA